MFKNKKNFGWDGFNDKSKPTKYHHFFTKSSKKVKVNRNSYLHSRMVIPVYENKSFKKFIISIFFYMIRPTLKKSEWKRNKDKNLELAERTYSKLFSKEFTFMPAGMALYLFLAFIPIWTIVLSIMSFSPHYSDILRNDILSRIIPGAQNSIPQIESFFTQSAGGTTSLVLLLLSSFWLSSNGFVKFIKSNSLVYDYDNITNVLILRIKGIFMVIGMSLVISVICLIMTPIISLLQSALGADSTIFLFLFYFIAIIVIFTSLYFGFILLFWISASFKLNWKHVKPGAMISTIPTCLFLIIFGSITSTFNYGKFGTIGTFMFLTILILQMSFYMYAGLIVNASYYRTYIGVKLIPRSFHSVKRRKIR